MLGSIKIVLDARDFSLTPHLAMEGYWESWVSVWAMANTLPTDRIMNIGANCGYFTLLFAKGGARVVAVEPQPFLAECIRLSAALNGWDERIVVRECVAGSGQGTVTLRLYDHLSGSAFVERAARDAGTQPAEGRLVVEERRAHELMPDATCVFVDAEGYEPMIWEGLKPLLDKGQLRWIALEWAPARYEDPVAFLAQLREYGTVSVVNSTGGETKVSDKDLLQKGDWDTVIVRRK